MTSLPAACRGPLLLSRREVLQVGSVSRGDNYAHAAAVNARLAGDDRGAEGGGAEPTVHPVIGSSVRMLRPPRRRGVPYVSMPCITRGGGGGPPQPGVFGGVLGR